MVAIGQCFESRESRFLLTSKVSSNVARIVLKKLTNLKTRRCGRKFERNRIVDDGNLISLRFLTVSGGKMLFLCSEGIQRWEPIENSADQR